MRTFSSSSPSPSTPIDLKAKWWLSFPYIGNRLLGCLLCVPRLEEGASFISKCKLLKGGLNLSVSPLLDLTSTIYVSSYLLSNIPVGYRSPHRRVQLTQPGERSSKTTSGEQHNKNIQKSLKLSNTVDLFYEFPSSQLVHHHQQQQQLLFHSPTPTSHPPPPPPPF